MNGYYLMSILFIMGSCQVNHGQSTDKSCKENQVWFAKGDWKQGWSVVADESVDSAEFEKQYSRNPARWEKAFHFLTTSDLQNIMPGRYELEGELLYVNVDQYQTKDGKDTRFEAHRRYADIQYLISGEEYIGVVPLSKMKEVTVPYSEEKDLVFYGSTENNYRLADNSRFFIFFPDDAHRPCLKVENNEQVKKIVVKVALD